MGRYTSVITIMLSLFLYHSCINKIIANEGFTNERTMLALSLSKDGKEKFLKNSLNRMSHTLKDILTSMSIPDQHFDVDESVCSSNKISQMNSVNIWQQCPGIPDLFFSDGAYIPNLRPRQVDIAIENMQVMSVNFEEIDVKCASDGSCHVLFPLKAFDFSFDLEIKQKYSSYSYPANEKLISFKNMKTHIGENWRGKMPVLRLKLNLSNERKNPLSFDLEGSRFVLPTGSFLLKSPRQKSMLLSELFNDSGRLSVNSYVFSALMTVAANFSEELSELFGLLDAGLTVNEHFDDSNKIVQLNNLINNSFLPSLLASLNSSIESLDIFSTKNISVPKYSLQDLFDEHKLESFLSDFDAYLDVLFAEIQIGENISKSSYAYADRSFAELTTCLEQSNNENILLLLEGVEAKLKKISLLIRKSVRQDYSEILDYVYELSDLSQDAMQNISNNLSLEEENILLKLSVFNSVETKGDLKLVVSELNNDGFDDVDQASKELDFASDFNSYVCFDTINNLLDIVNSNGLLSFKLSEHLLLTGLQSENVTSSNDIETAYAPEILWDENYKSHYLKVGLIFDGFGVTEYKIYFKVSKNLQGVLSFDSKIEAMNPPKGLLLGRKVLSSLLIYVKSLHPILDSLIPSDMDKLQEQVQEKSDFENIDLSWLNFTNLDLGQRSFTLKARLR